MRCTKALLILLSAAVLAAPTPVSYGIAAEAGALTEPADYAARELAAAGLEDFAGGWHGVVITLIVVAAVVYLVLWIWDNEHYGHEPAQPPGLLLPVVHFSWALKADTSFTVLTGISDLLRSGHTFIGLLILIFSVIFPVAKILALYGLWFLPLPEGSRGSSLRWLEFLGKWSMLDVFVVGILIGTLNLGILSDATPGPGAYVFTGAVLMSMAATLGQARLARRTSGPPPLPARPSVAVPILAAVSLLLLGAGLLLPLMTVDKWLFWKNEYSILGGTAVMFQEGHTAMAAMVTVFVIAAPMLQAVCAMWVWLLGRPRKDRARLMTGLRQVGRWAMADVFALGLAVVLAKIGGVVNVSAGPGLGFFIAGTALGSAVAWHLTAPRAIRPAKVRGKGEKKKGKSRPGERERNPMFPKGRLREVGEMASLN